MTEEAPAIRRMRVLEEWLHVPIAEDERAIVTQIHQQHDLERMRLLAAVALADEPGHIFAPLRRAAPGAAGQ